MQMGSQFKKSVVSENVRKSLSKWHRRVKGRQISSTSGTTTTTTTVTMLSHLMTSEMVNSNFNVINSEEGRSSGTKESGLSHDIDHVSDTLVHCNSFTSLT